MKMGMWNLSKNKPRTFMMMGRVVKLSFNWAMVMKNRGIGIARMSRGLQNITTHHRPEKRMGTLCHVTPYSSNGKDKVSIMEEEIQNPKKEDNDNHFFTHDFEVSGEEWGT
jgi:hypothetical protein